MITRGICTIDGQAVDTARLEAGNMVVDILSFGAITWGWSVNGRQIVHRYDDPAEYGADKAHIGAIAGRVANRIAKGRFTLDGQEVQLPLNEGENHLHGGPNGFGHRHWQMHEAGENAVRLSLISEDGDNGYPGRADFEIVITLTETSLTYDMRAEVDRPTPINLAQHSYYNLQGGGEVWDHVLTVPAGDYLEAGDDLIITGRLLPVEGTKYDFRAPRRIGDADADHNGLDGCLVLSEGTPAAELSAPDGPTLRFFTNQPGLQVYNSNMLREPFGRFTAVCLEPQGFPDAVNHPNFPSIIARPDAPYVQKLVIEVS